MTGRRIAAAALMAALGMAALPSGAGAGGPSRPGAGVVRASTVNPDPLDRARSIRDAARDLLQLTKEQIRTVSVPQADEMRTVLREADGYILSTRRLLDGEPL